MSQCATCGIDVGEVGAHIEIQNQKFCGKCAVPAKESYRKHLLVEARKILVSTTDTLDGYRIVGYAGTIFAACVDVLSGYADAAADVIDFLGLSGAYEASIYKLHRDAEHKLRVVAAHRGAQAVVGAHFDLEFVEGVDEKSILNKRDRKVMVAASGTAVSVQPT